MDLMKIVDIITMLDDEDVYVQTLRTSSKSMLVLK